jgi:hypothetical protein
MNFENACSLREQDAVSPGETADLSGGSELPSEMRARLLDRSSKSLLVAYSPGSKLLSYLLQLEQQFTK